MVSFFLLFIFVNVRISKVNMLHTMDSKTKLLRVAYLNVQILTNRYINL